MTDFKISTSPDMHSSFQMVVNCSTILISTSLDFFLYFMMSFILDLKTSFDLFVLVPWWRCSSCPWRLPGCCTCYHLDCFLGCFLRHSFYHLSCCLSCHLDFSHFIAVHPSWQDYGYYSKWHSNLDFGFRRLCKYFTMLALEPVLNCMQQNMAIYLVVDFDYQITTMAIMEQSN